MAYNNPATAAMPYMQQIPGVLQQYYSPYANAGQGSLNTLMQQYNTLLNNPQAIMQMAGSGYQQSPGYQYQYDQAMNAQNSAAASGGMLGTPYHQENAATTANDLANQDYEQYLNQTLGLYGKGLEGEQGLNQMGYNASNELATGLATNLGNEGGMAYSGVAGQNAYDAAQEAAQNAAKLMKGKSESDFWDSLVGGISSIIPSLFGTSSK